MKGRYMSPGRTTESNSEGSCLARIRSQVKGSPKCRARVARFVIDFPSQARNMTIGEMATACETSTASVSRLCRSVGYTSYKEFQLDLAASIAQAGKAELDNFAAGMEPPAIVHNVFERNRRSLVDTEKLLDHAALLDVAKAISRAKRIFFVGLGGSGPIAHEAAERFLSLGLTAIAVTDPFDQVFVTANAGRDDVVLGISHTGQTASIVEAVKAARQRGAQTAALTNYPLSSLAAAARFLLRTGFHEHRINAAVSSSRTSQICVIDSLYFIVASWGGPDARKLADEAEKRTRALLRGKGNPMGPHKERGPYKKRGKATLQSNEEILR